MSIPARETSRARRESRPPMWRADGSRSRSSNRAPGTAHAVVSALALLMLAAWAWVWIKSVGDNRFALGQLTWVPALRFMAGDFRVHLDHVARVYASGINPYRLRDDWACMAFPYPPMVPRLFAWVTLVSPDAAVKIWLTTLASVLGLGGFAAWRTREELTLCRLPLALILAGLAWSTPALLAMERGQCDPAVIPALLAVAWLLREPASWRDLAAGALLAVTAWLKYYPGLAVIAFLALRRWRGLAAFVVVAGLIGVYDLDNVRKSIENGLAISQSIPKRYPTLPTNHSIIGEWRSLWVQRFIPLMRKVPPPYAATLLLIPPVVLVSRRIGRSACPGPLIFPWLLWLTASATFAMPYSVDYNLVILPLAALAVWDPRDPPPVHLALGLLLVWWQPFSLAIRGEWLFYIKLAALYAVGLSLMRRALELRPGVIMIGDQSPITFKAMATRDRLRSRLRSFGRKP